MATQGIKRIKISSIDKEGNQNKLRLLNLENLIIDHPKGINDINNIGISGSGIIGGPASYIIDNIRQNEYDYLYTTTPNSVINNITQNRVPNITVYSTSSVSESIKVFTNRINSSSKNFFSNEYQWAIPSGGFLRFPTSSSGNIAGWWDGNKFSLKEIPNTQYRFNISGHLTRVSGSGLSVTQSVYCVIYDAGVTNTLVSSSFNQASSGLGYIKQPVIVSASFNSSQSVEWDIIVTQSYSRILNKPLGPTYGNTYYTLGNDILFTTEPPEWRIAIISDKASVNNSSISDLIVSPNNPLKLEINLYPTTSVASDTYNNPIPLLYTGSFQTSYVKNLTSNTSGSGWSVVFNGIVSGTNSYIYPDDISLNSSSIASSSFFKDYLSSSVASIDGKQLLTWTNIGSLDLELSFQFFIKNIVYYNTTSPGALSRSPLYEFSFHKLDNNNNVITTSSYNGLDYSLTQQLALYLASGLKTIPSSSVFTLSPGEKFISKITLLPTNSLGINNTYPFSFTGGNVASSTYTWEIYSSPQQTFQAGNTFNAFGVDWIVLPSYFIPGISSSSLGINNINDWVQNGYISAYNIINFPYNSFYNENFSYKGFRISSLITTSSLIPLIDTTENYLVSEFNPLINNVDIYPKSNIYYDLDYSNGMSSPTNLPQVIQTTATKASINDSNYSRESWNNIRYRGSRVTSPGINKT
jgi:hypothetical protein